MAKWLTSFSNAVTLPSESDHKLVELSVKKLNWNQGEIIGIFIHNYHWNGFLLNNLLFNTVHHDSAFHIVHTSTGHSQNRISLLKRLKSRLASEGLNMTFTNVEFNKFHELTFPENLKFDRFFCLHDLVYFEDTKSFFETLSQNIMKPKGHIGFIVPFSKMYEVPRRLFNNELWREYDKKSSGDLLPGERIASWACDTSKENFDIVINSFKSTGFEFLEAEARFEDSETKKFKNIRELYETIAQTSHSESFCRVNRDSKLEKCLASLTHVARDCLAPSDTSSLNEQIEVPFKYLTFVAEKK